MARTCNKKEIVWWNKTKEKQAAKENIGQAEQPKVDEFYMLWYMSIANIIYLILLLH